MVSEFARSPVFGWQWSTLLLDSPRAPWIQSESTCFVSRRGWRASLQVRHLCLRCGLVGKVLPRYYQTLVAQFFLPGFVLCLLQNSSLITTDQSDRPLPLSLSRSPRQV